MNAEFSLTPQPIRLTATGKQFLSQSLDVSLFDQADALLYVVTLEGTSSPTATIRLITGMQMDSEDGWVVAASFPTVSASNTPQKLNVTGLLKYIRWELSGLTGTTPVVTFSISGILRNN
jgi:hypothetical protein